MSDLVNDISDWIRARPFQDKQGWVETPAAKTFTPWDEWVRKGKEIPDSEDRLIEMLEHDKEPVTRSATAMALGFVGGQRSVNPLIATLQNDIPLVAMEAAASLGRLGASAAIEPLCAGLKNADANVRANACTALGSLGGEKALAALREAEKDHDPFVRAAAKEALSRSR
jgi:bilin biosynthesis protein